MSVQKRHNTRIYPVDTLNPNKRPGGPDAGGPGGKGNVQPGTVVDCLGSPQYLDYYMVSHEGVKVSGMW